METTLALIGELLLLFKQLAVAMETRNLRTLAAMTALLLKGKPAHLSKLGSALPGKGNSESRIQKLRRWVANPKITPAHSLEARLALISPVLAPLPNLLLLIDRTEWTRLGVSVNLFICSVVVHSRSLPLSWCALPTRGCSSLSDQQALLTPVFEALAAHPRLAQMPTGVVADREFCSPTLAVWLRSVGIGCALRVKQSYRISRTDIPAIPLRTLLKHCQPGEWYFFPDVCFTDAHRFQAHLAVYWRDDCEEPLALMTDFDEATAAMASYHDRIFIETLNRDFKSSGYDLERGRLTDAHRVTNLLIPVAFAYILTVLHGLADETASLLPHRHLSLFSRARTCIAALLDRATVAHTITCFQQFFQFVRTLIRQPNLFTAVRHVQQFAKKQRLLLQGVT